MAHYSVCKVFAFGMEYTGFVQRVHALMRSLKESVTHSCRGNALPFSMFFLENQDIRNGSVLFTNPSGHGHGFYVTGS